MAQSETVTVQKGELVQKAAETAVQEPKPNITFSETYCDDVYEYRHVRLPKDWKTRVPPRVMTEHEWRMLGVDQASAWKHYAVHRPEPHLLMFRRPLPGQKNKEEEAKPPGSVNESVCSPAEQ